MSLISSKNGTALDYIVAEGNANIFLHRIRAEELAFSKGPQRCGEWITSSTATATVLTTIIIIFITALGWNLEERERDRETETHSLLLLFGTGFIAGIHRNKNFTDAAHFGGS